MAAELKTPLAVALFEAYSRNCGHNPDEHYDRNAAEQWMTQALDECGVTELIGAIRSERRARTDAATGPATTISVFEATRRTGAALARIGGTP